MTVLPIVIVEVIILAVILVKQIDSSPFLSGQSEGFVVSAALVSE
jgi:hypothetical protein